MKLHLTKSTLYSFTIALAVLGLLALPYGGSYGMDRGQGFIASSEQETQEEEVNWTLANNSESEEDETDWTLANNSESEEDETDWTLANNSESEEDETDWTLA